MLTYEQVLTQVREIMDKDPDPKLAKELANVVARAEKQTMELIDQAMLYGSAFRKVQVTKEQAVAAAIQEELSRPGPALEVDPLGMHYTTELLPIPYESISSEFLQSIEETEKARGSIREKMAEATGLMKGSTWWANFPGFIYKSKVHEDSFNRDVAGMKIKNPTYRLATGYEGDGAKAIDKVYLGKREYQDALLRAMKRNEDTKAGEPLRDAISALHNCWRSDGRPHKYEVD